MTRLFAWAGTTREQLGSHRPYIEQVDVDRDITICRTQMSDEAFSIACKAGKMMSSDEAIAYDLVSE